MKYDITFHPSWWYKNVGIEFTQEFFDDPEYRMECDVKMRRALYQHFGDYGLGEENPEKRPLLGTDLLAAGYLYSELMGCEIVYQPDNSPQVMCAQYDEDQMGEIQIPDLDQSPVWKRTEKQIQYLLEKYGHVEPYVNLMGIQNIAMDLMGQELLMAYYTSPEEVELLLEKITKLSIEVGKRFKALSSYISGGVTAIVRQVQPAVYLTSNCSVEMISAQLYEKYLLKCDQQLADAFGCFGVHHCGATMEHVVESYAKIQGLTFAEVGAFSDIKRVREVLPQTFLNARYSPVRLTQATKEEIVQEVQDLVQDGVSSQGDLLSVSCVGIDHSVPDQQIIHFLETCKNL